MRICTMCWDYQASTTEAGTRVVLSYLLFSKLPLHLFSRVSQAMAHMQVSCVDDGSASALIKRDRYCSLGLGMVYISSNLHEVNSPLSTLTSC
jgi:hypothetical protein